MKDLDAPHHGEEPGEDPAPGSPARRGAAAEEAAVAPDEQLIAIEAVFDIAAALRARDALARLIPGSQVVVDLTRVGESHDAAFAVLADGIARLAGVAVRFRGLTERQGRMLRYFGIGPGDRRP